jgi:hypothetical protein
LSGKNGRNTISRFTCAICLRILIWKSYKAGFFAKKGELGGWTAAVGLLAPPYNSAARAWTSCGKWCMTAERKDKNG